MTSTDLDLPALLAEFARTNARLDELEGATADGSSEPHTDAGPMLTFGGDVTNVDGSILGGGDASIGPATTLRDIADHAMFVLKAGTAINYASSLRFLANGWSITPPQQDDVERVMRGMGMHVPSFDRLPRVEGADRIVMWSGFGDAPAASILGASIDIGAKHARINALVNGLQRDRKRAKLDLPSLGWTGGHAVEHVACAMAWAYGVLRSSNVLDADLDPLSTFTVPPRDASNRRENTDEELLDLYEALQLHSSDPELAMLLFRYHLWTANRPVAAVNQKLGDVDLEKCTMTSVTKYGRTLTVPAPRQLIEDCLALAARRGSTAPDDPMFRSKNKARSHDGLAALSYNFYYRQMARPVQLNVPWAATERWSVYWLRHTAKARVQQIGGVDTAIALLGHRDRHTIEAYGKAPISKVAWAVSIMTGHPHPLAVEPAFVRGMP